MWCRKYKELTHDIYCSFNIGKSNKNLTPKKVLYNLTSIEDRNVHKLFDQCLNLWCILMSKIKQLWKYGIVYII